MVSRAKSYPFLWISCLLVTLAWNLAAQETPPVSEPTASELVGPIANSGGQANPTPRKLPAKRDVNRVGQRRVSHRFDLYSMERERALGESLAARIESGTKLIRDRATNEYVNALADKISRNSDAQMPITVKVIDSMDVNIFSLPGGFVYVDRGLILQLDNEAELASLMAHEIAHIAARHATYTITRRYVWDGVSLPLVYLGGPLGFFGARFGGPLLFRKFSRDDEREADLLGIQYAYVAGYDPAAFVEALEKLQQLQQWKWGGLRKLPLYRQFTRVPFRGVVTSAIASQPEMEGRIKTLQKEISELLPPNREYVLDTSDFDEAKDHLDWHPVLRRGLPSDKANDQKDRPKLHIHDIPLPGRTPPNPEPGQSMAFR